MMPPQNSAEEDDFGIEYFDDIVDQRMRGGQPFAQEQQFELEEAPSVETESLARRAIGGLGRAIEGIGQRGLLVPKDMPRHVARSVSRIVEQRAGMMGDIRELAKFGGEWLTDKARSSMGKEPLTEEQKEYIREKTKPADWNLIGRLGEAMPTSRDVRGYIRNYTGEYLEPTNNWERFSDEVMSDYGALSMGSKGIPAFVEDMGKSVLVNAGGEVAGAFGGEDIKNKAKIGLFFLTGLMGRNQQTLKNFMDDLYTDMRAEIPEGASISAKPLTNKLDKIESALKKGDPSAASKQAPLQKIDAIRNKVSGGEIPVEEVLELTRDVSESIYSSKGLVRAQNKLYDIREALQDTTKEYGATNEAFASKWKEANQAFASTELSRKLGSWVKKNINPKDYAYAASALGLEGALAGAPIALKTAGGAAAIGATAYSAEVFKRIAQSKALRRYYLNTTNAALQQNKTAFIRNMKFLNDGLEESFELNPYETIDFEDEE